MKSIPPEILRAFPPPPDAPFPSRPWWTCRNGKLPSRRDDPDLVVHKEAEAANRDASHPLAFPGLRPGQVWAIVRPDWRVDFLEVPTAWLRTGMQPNDVRDYFLVGDLCCPHFAPWSWPEQ